MFHRKGQNRFITVTKKKESKGKIKADFFEFSEDDQNKVAEFLKKYPVTTQEKDDLTPPTEKPKQVADSM